MLGGGGDGRKNNSAYCFPWTFDFLRRNANRTQVKKNMEKRENSIGKELCARKVHSRLLLNILIYIIHHDQSWGCSVHLQSRFCWCIIWSEWCCDGYEVITFDFLLRPNLKLIVVFLAARAFLNCGKERGGQSRVGTSRADKLYKCTPWAIWWVSNIHGQ